MSFQNQKIIKVIKENCNKENLYTVINLQALQNAMNNLKGETFKLWIYLSKNQNGYQLELSQKACLEWGIKKDAYYAAVEKLIKLHYLQPIYDGSNIYTFSETPKKETNSFSEDKNGLSEKTTEASKIQKNPSENPERNNINNTLLIQDSISSPFSYLEKVIYGDGYIVSQDTWMDCYHPSYWDAPLEKRISWWMDLGYSESESKYIASEIVVG